jgi:hypothetical protein
MISSENCSLLKMWLANTTKTHPTLPVNSLTPPPNPITFPPQQLVLLDKHSFLGKNQKLAPKWSGPHKILHLKGDCNIKIQLKHNNQKTLHANRFKPYFVASKNWLFGQISLKFNNLHNSLLLISAPLLLRKQTTPSPSFMTTFARPQIFLIYNTRKWLNCKIHHWL